MLVERYLNSRIRSAHRGEPNTAFLQLVICRDWEIVPSIRRTSIPDFPIYYRRGHANVKSIKEYNVTNSVLDCKKVAPPSHMRREMRDFIQHNVAEHAASAIMVGRISLDWSSLKRQLE